MQKIKTQISKILKTGSGIVAGMAISLSLISSLPKSNISANHNFLRTESNNIIKLEKSLVKNKVDNIKLKKNLYDSQEGLMINNIKTRNLSVDFVFRKDINNSGHGAAYILNGVPDKGMNWIQLFVSYKYGSVNYKYPHFGVQIWNKNNQFIQHMDSMKYVKPGDIISMSMKFSKYSNYIYVSVEDLNTKKQNFKMKLKSENANEFISQKDNGNCGEYFTGLMTEKYIKKPEFIKAGHSIVYTMPKPFNSVYMFYDIVKPNANYCNDNGVIKYYWKTNEKLNQNKKIIIYNKNNNRINQEIEQIKSNKFVTY